MENLSAEDQAKLDKAKRKQEEKAARAIRENRITAVLPTGLEKAPSFTRVSKGRQKLWSRQYMQNKKTGTIVKVEINEE